MSKLSLSLQELYDQAKQHELSARFPQAIKLYQDIIRQNPKFKYAYTSLGNCFVQSKDSTRAIKAYKKSVQLTNDVNAKFNLGILYYHLGMFGKSSDHLAEVVKSVENRDAYLFLAKALFMDRDFVQAETVLKKAFEKTRDSRFREMLEKLKEQKSRLEEKFPGESKVLERIKKDPHVLRNYNLLTVHYLRNNRHDKAESILKQAVENNSENLVAYTNLAGYYFDRQQFRDAIRVLEKAVKLRPEEVSIENINCHVNLAHAYSNVGEKKNAVKILEKAIKLNPPNAKVLKQMLEEMRKD